LSPLDVPELARLLTVLEPMRLHVAEVSQPLHVLLDQLHLEHVIAVPLLAGGELYGVVTTSWSNETAPPVEESDLTLRLRGVADATATALQNARLVSEVRYQALHDALTGVPNRVLFTDRLEQALRARTPGSVGVLFCDLDRFKQVNDAHGHAVGDELLRQAAARIVTAVREGDSVGRLSGDEFAVLLPDVASVPAALAVAQRVTACFERPFRIEGQDLRVTISVGVALHAGPGGRVDQLLRYADAAMYDAKQRGPNLVSVHRGDLTATSSTA
jgi:diguanylate cyclase (GGDEF)-like protein